MSWAMTAVGGITLASTMIGDSQGSQEARQKAKDFGTHQGAVKESAARMRNKTSEEAAAIQDNKILGRHSIEQGLQISKANAKVNAAMAGTSGASVESSINETDANAGRAIGALDVQNKQELRQLRQNSIDLSLDADSQLGELKVIKPQSQLSRFATGALNSTTELAGAMGALSKAFGD